ncbi:MAG: hypothetical protein OXC82_07725 [Rhodobacteraceae bacterium]|nr:hypothetical protein [Paracoccaceae bacterium]
MACAIPFTCRLAECLTALCLFRMPLHDWWSLVPCVLSGTAQVIDADNLRITFPTVNPANLPQGRSLFSGGGVTTGAAASKPRSLAGWMAAWPGWMARRAGVPMKHRPAAAGKRL